MAYCPQAAQRFDRQGVAMACTCVPVSARGGGRGSGSLLPFQGRRMWTGLVLEDGCLQGPNKALLYCGDNSTYTVSVLFL